jgi:hypothetical protein
MTTLSLATNHRISKQARLALSVLADSVYLPTRIRKFRDDDGYSHGEQVSVYAGPLNSHLDSSRLVGKIILWSDDPSKELPATTINYDIFGKEINMEQLRRAEVFKHYLKNQGIQFRQEPSSEEVENRINILRRLQDKMIS